VWQRNWMIDSLANFSGLKLFDKIRIQQITREDMRTILPQQRLFLPIDDKQEQIMQSHGISITMRRSRVF